MQRICIFVLSCSYIAACGGSGDDDNDSQNSSVSGDDDADNDTGNGADDDDSADDDHSGGTDDDSGVSSRTPGGIQCAAGFTCTEDPDSETIWVIKNDGNVNGPTCERVCSAALAENCEYRACDVGRPIAFNDIESFAPIADGLGFTCREGGCWWPEAPAEGLYLVSIDTDEDGTKSCFFPTESVHSCRTHPGNANCFGERYASVCPCVPRDLDQACEWECPPHNTTRATWKTDGTSCLERINYWRVRACEEGWVECPPSGLPPMVECTACHKCSNSEAEFDSENGAHASFKRCGEGAQGEGGGQTCADVIDAFVSERAPDEGGVMRCQGHCGPILAPGCRSFSWGKARDSGFHTLNWGNCNVETCETYCAENSGDCYTHDTSPPLSCEDPDDGSEPSPEIQICQ